MCFQKIRNRHFIFNNRQICLQRLFCCRKRNGLQPLFFYAGSYRMLRNQRNQFVKPKLSGLLQKPLISLNVFGGTNSHREGIISFPYPDRFLFYFTLGLFPDIQQLASIKSSLSVNYINSVPGLVSQYLNAMSCLIFRQNDFAAGYVL